MVNNPKPDHEEADREPYETTIGGLATLIVGTGIKRWYEEQTSIYDSKAEAQKDADKRWNKIQKFQKSRP